LSEVCEEVELHLAYRWFCRLDLDDNVPDHSTFSVNRHGRFRDSDLFRQGIRGGGAGVHERRSGQG
jgi:transposase